MPRVVLIGAGSAQFARRLITDLLSWPELAGGEIALVDIDSTRLELVAALAGKMIADQGTGTRLIPTADRTRALDGADYVMTTIAVGYAYERHRPELLIPRRYGLHQTSADGITVGGVFRYLRTIPTMLAIGHDMLRLCPQALWLNYVKPLNMTMWTLAAELPALHSVDLCHSVQGTARRLAGYIGVPPEAVAYWVAGINHMAWFLQFRPGSYRGEDLYPRLHQAAQDPEILAGDRVRFAVLQHFGAFVSESSLHMSEFVPWFRRTRADRERYTPYTMPAEQAFLDGLPPTLPRQDVWDDIKRQLAGVEPIDYARSREYGTAIIHAIKTNTPFRFNGNVPNSGLITKLPPGCNVEVPILVDNTGLHPCVVGDLPAPLAALCRTNINVQELAVQGFLQRDRDAIFQAAALDPLGAATMGLDETRAMVDDLFEANARWLDGYEARIPHVAGATALDAVAAH